MNITPNTPGNRADSVDQAASLLVHLGRTIDDQVDPGTPLHCLVAADNLICAGAHPERLTVPLPDSAAAIAALHQVLQLLADLPADVLSRDLVLDAATETRTALAMAV
jgi:hypothetical protein